MNTVCACGHVERLHPASGCSCCRCDGFAPATDPDAATEAARARQATEQQLLTTARRALAMRHYPEAMGAVAALARLEREAQR